MFSAYPEQQRSRWRVKWLIPAVSCVVVVILYGEHAVHDERPVHRTELKDFHFLQPFLSSPGFEVGIWTRHRGENQSAPTSRRPPAQESSLAPFRTPADTTLRPTASVADAVQAEVDRLRSQLEAERFRSAQQRAEIDRLQTSVVAMAKPETSPEKVAAADSSHDQSLRPGVGVAEDAPVESKESVPAVAPAVSLDAVAVAAPAGTVAGVRATATPEENFRATEAPTTSPVPTSVPPLTPSPPPPPPPPTPSPTAPALESKAPEPAPASGVQQPQITVKAGGQEIHVKLGDAVPAPVAPREASAVTSSHDAAAVGVQLSQPSSPVSAGTAAPPEMPDRQASQEGAAMPVEAAVAPINTTRPAATVDVGVPLASSAKVEASQGTQITLKSQGQTITIEIGGTEKKPDPGPPPSPLAAPAPAPVPPPSTTALEDTTSTTLPPATSTTLAPTTSSVMPPAPPPTLQPLPPATPSLAPASPASSVAQPLLPAAAANGTAREKSSVERVFFLEPISVPAAEPASPTPAVPAVVDSLTTSVPAENGNSAADTDRYAMLALRVR